MKLNSKLLIIYGIIGAILLAVVGNYANITLKREKFQSIQENFVAQLYQLDFAISSFLAEVEYDVIVLATDERVRTRDDSHFTQFLDADEATFVYDVGTTEQEIIDLFNNHRTSHPYVNSVYMGRENGSFVRSHKRNRPTQYDPRVRPWYQLAKGDPDRVMRTAPYQSVTIADVNIGTVKALVDEQGQVYGVVGMDVTLRNLTEYISNVRVGENGYIVLLDDNGIVLTGRDEEIRFKRYDEAGLDYFQAVMDNTQGHTSFTEEFAGENAKNYLFYFTSPALGWKICAVIPAQEIDREVRQFVNKIMLILAASLFLLSALTTVGVRKFIVKPIKKLQRSTEVIMQTGDLNHRITMETGDEIGQLAASLNEMMESIKRTEAELRRSEEKYRGLVENINTGVFRTTVEPARFLHVNSALVTILEYDSADELIKVAPTEFYENPQERTQLIRQLRDERFIKGYELRLKKKDGTFIWAELNVTAQYDKDGRIKWLQGVVEDITARRRAQEALRRAYDELELRVAERTAELTREIAERKRVEVALRESQRRLEASYRREQERRRLSDTLRTVARIVSGTLEQQKVLDLILGQLEKVVTYHRATVMLLTDDRTQPDDRAQPAAPLLTLVAGRDKRGGAVQRITIEAYKYPLNAVTLREKYPILLPDVTRDDRWRATGDMEAIRSFISAPLLVKNRPIGILAVGRRDAVPYTVEDTQTVFAFASQVAVALEQARLYEYEMAQIERELEIARQIQISLLPLEAPEVTGLDIAGLSHPARHVGGDFYNYFVFERAQHAAPLLGIAVGDVSGKGMRAALMMALSFGLLTTEVRREATPAELLAALNTELRPHTERNRTNTALVYLTLEPTSGGAVAPGEGAWELRASNAGLIAPLVRRYDGTVEWLDVGDFPLGIREVEYEEVRQTLRSGDVLILSSDGVVEAMNEAGELYSFDRLAACVTAIPCFREGHDEYSAQEIQERILEDVRAFAGAAEAHDDLTLIVVVVS